MFDKSKLTKLLKQRGISSQELASTLNNFGIEISEESIKKYRQGKANMSLDTLSTICEILNVPEQDFFTGVDTKIKIAKNEIKKNPREFETILSKNSFEFIKKIPLLDGYVGAGSFGDNSNIEKLDDIYVDIHSISKQYRDKDIEAIRVAGDSMYPYISEGDIVLYCKFIKNESVNGDGKYIISTNQGEQVKNLSFKLNGDVVISSENQSYPPETVSKESQEYLSVVGKVVGRILRG